MALWVWENPRDPDFSEGPSAAENTNNFNKGRGTFRIRYA
jgi:hypothetical protein